MGNGQAFGRFGYVESWQVPGLVLDRAGFRSEYQASDTIKFTQPLGQWKPVSTSDMSQLVSTGVYVGSPSKLRQDLSSPGFTAYFPKGIRLTLASNLGAYLTWQDGSIDVNTPYTTPASGWVVVSFRDAQPPILFSFLDSPGGLRVSGRSGQWTLTSDPNFSGWVRISAPLGLRSFATNSVADLGRLDKACREFIDIAKQAPPALTGLRVTDEGAGVLAEWSYDRPGAIIPFPVFLAPMGGYSVQVASKVKRLDCPTSSGPLYVTDEPRLSLRLTARRVPTGRAVALGSSSGDVIGTTSPLDYAGVTEMALANLVSTQEKGSRDLAMASVAEFLGEAAYQVEPFTGQRLPYDGPGNGLDLAAAHSLLLQTTLTTTKATSEPNSLLTSLMWRRDWLTWQITCADSAKRRRAEALASLAAALAPEPERRLDGAMLQAGLAAERGLAVWLKRTQKGPEPSKFLEVMSDVREDLFGKDDYRRKPGYGRMILSDVRAFGDVPVTLAADGDKRLLRWTAGDSRGMTITLAAAYPIEVSAGKNVADLQLTQGLGFSVLRITPKDAGPCEAEVKFPSFAQPLPAWVAPPRYLETNF